MRAKTLIELLTLSTNIYMISKDEEFMHNLAEMAEKGKQKAHDLKEKIFSEDESEETMIHKFLEKAKQAKEEMEHKMGEIAEGVYAKMKIAHTNEITKLNDELESLKRELALAEARIVHLEQKHG